MTFIQHILNEVVLRCSDQIASLYLLYHHEQLIRNLAGCFVAGNRQPTRKVTKAASGFQRSMKLQDEAPLHSLKAIQKVLFLQKGGNLSYYYRGLGSSISSMQKSHATSGYTLTEQAIEDATASESQSITQPKSECHLRRKRITPLGP